jgi:hypothetical protein
MLAALIRSLTDSVQYRRCAHYAGLIAELQELRDTMNEAPQGSADYNRAYAAASVCYKAARAYASKWSFDPPNAVMAQCGYSAV